LTDARYLNITALERVVSTWRWTVNGLSSRIFLEKVKIVGCWRNLILCLELLDIVLSQLISAHILTFALLFLSYAF